MPRELSFIRRRGARGQRGLTLMEVLIAMLVLAIGLLGLAALQTLGLRFGNEAYTRSQATTLAYEIIEAMRANRANVASYLVTADALDALDDPAAVDCDPASAVPQEQLTCWIEYLKTLLPGVRASISANADPNYVDVVISWTDRELLTQAACENVSNRTWDTDLSVCLASQTWTVFP